MNAVWPGMIPPSVSNGRFSRRSFRTRIKSIPGWIRRNTILFMANKTYLVTGAGGQLGAEFVMQIRHRQGAVLSFRHRELDITDEKRVAEVIREDRPDVVINCASFNRVDDAEDSQEEAMRVNAQAVRNLARVCREQGGLVVHFSTDYVFPGRQEPRLYTEEDQPQPLSVYGQSKREGEKFLMQETENHLLLRTSWLFGLGNNNFLYKLSQWSRESKELKIADDEISTPTYTRDVVDATLQAIEKGLKGLYHITNSGYCSRFELAKFYFEQIGRQIRVTPVSTKTFHLKAKRPAFSAMSHQKLSATLNQPMPSWQDAVQRYLHRQGLTATKRPVTGLPRS